LFDLIVVGSFHTVKIKGSLKKEQNKNGEGVSRVSRQNPKDELKINRRCVFDELKNLPGYHNLFCLLFFMTIIKHATSIHLPFIEHDNISNLT